MVEKCKVNRSECIKPNDPRFKELKAYIDSVRDQNGINIMVLQEAQRLFGYVPLEVQKWISLELDTVSVGELYGITTFYSQFNLKKQGKHKISVCLGTACYVKGAQAILEALQQHLDVEVGGISEDGMFTLEATRCLGCCSLAPVMMIDNDVYAKLYDTKEIPEILDKYYLESELDEELENVFESEVDA
ncbi:MAG: NAD(P)H-dependent oxidoreductase subunit E [Eubacteriales bacterium]|nr:NAD(P)H-dependent oxidoreductase subunit E [Eubacteriales bacterium]